MSAPVCETACVGLPYSAWFCAVREPLEGGGLAKPPQAATPAEITAIAGKFQQYG
jgi:hypothetical protein